MDDEARRDGHERAKNALMNVKAERAGIAQCDRPRPPDSRRRAGSHRYHIGRRIGHRTDGAIDWLTTPQVVFGSGTSGLTGQSLLSARVTG